MSFITIIYNMFDIKYYAMLKAVEENHNTISSYTELRGINNKEDYENLWLNVMYKYDIDVHDYTEILGIMTYHILKGRRNNTGRISTA